LAKAREPSTIGASEGDSEEHDVADKPANSEADWILKAMVAVAGSDGQLDARETGLIQQVYQDQSGRALSVDEIAREADAVAKGDAIAEFAAAAKVLDQAAKEEVIRAAYLVLLADDRIAGEERKKLKDIAAALQVSEIHFGAILENLAIWLAQQRS
jgi:tellurite resistance protein